MTATIIWTIVAITVLGVLLAVVLYLVANKFKVEEDPRIDEVEKVMPGANCGGCGFAGCRAFAQSCVEAANLDNNYCPVGGNEVMKKVAAVLGLEVKEKAPMVAVVRCNGTCAKRPVVNDYDGLKSCRTFGHTFPAQLAFVEINICHIVLYRNGSERTCFGTFPASYAGG